MTHHINKCKYGYLHGQCKCPSKDKQIRIVECNTLTHAENPKNIPPYMPKHRKEEDD